MARYRFRLPDGQTFESERTLTQIRKAHPTATITHRVEFDAVGNPQMVPFEGEKAAPKTAGEMAAEYEELTVPVLKEQAEQRGLEVDSGAKKADIVALLVASDQERLNAVEAG